MLIQLCVIFHNNTDYKLRQICCVALTSGLNLSGVSLFIWAQMHHHFDLFSRRRSFHASKSIKSQHRHFCTVRLAGFRALPSYDKRPSLWERYISVRQRAEDLFPLLSSLSFTSTSCPYFSKMAHQLLQEQTFPPRALIMRSGCFTRRRVCFSYKSSFGSCCYSDPRLRSLPSARPSTWQHFANVLALTRPRCLRLSCELSARSTGSSLLFLALSECWLSALLFCLLSLHFYHVGKFFCALGPVHLRAGEQHSPLKGLWHAAQLLLANAELR